MILSRNMLKKVGESRYPCQTPTVAQNQSPTLFNQKANGDPSPRNCTQTDTEDGHPILRREVEAAVQSLKKGKSAGFDNVPVERINHRSHDNLQYDLADWVVLTTR